MLQTIREYVLEKLDVDGEAARIRDRHARHYLEFALSRKMEIFGECPGEWLDSLEKEHENVRAALNWFLVQSDATDALKLLGALALFWLHRKLNSVWGINNVIQRMGIIDYYHGQYNRAAHMFKSILTHHQTHNAMNNLLGQRGTWLGTPERYL